jgi:hypothetical protein
VTATHISLDIETLGLKPGNVVLSAALVRFDDLASTSVQIHIGEQQAAGLTINDGTRAWWSQQSPAAQAAAFAPAPPLRDALAHIATWLQWAASGASGQEFFLWCHGAGFDAPMLAAVFEAAAVPVPWTYRQVRDTRTLYDLAGVSLGDFSGGTYHNALDDAMAQTRAAVAAMNRIAGAMMGRVAAECGA